MMSPITINTIEAENTKRVKAVSMQCTEKGLVVVGGRNREGKSSLLDAIAWTLGGEKFRPSEPDNSETGEKARTRVELSNGLIAERKGKNGSLTVTDPDGQKSGQKILSEIIDEMALDLPRFLESSTKAKAKTLLKILGVEEELQKLEEQENKLYQERESIGQQARRAKNYAEELPYHEDVPAQPISAQELMKKNQAVLERNAERENARRSMEQRKTDLDASAEAVDRQVKRIDWIKQQLKDAEDDLAKLKEKNSQCKAALEEAEKQEISEPESTAEIEAEMEKIEQTNAMVRANQEKARAQKEAEKLENEYGAYNQQIAEVRNNITALLEGAELPLPELTVRGDELLYRDQKWDCMSGSEQLKVAAAIVRRLNPNCGFVLIDKLEQMDLDTLQDFAQWAEREGLQVIGTRVSTGEECALIIEDGTAGVATPKKQNKQKKQTEKKTKADFSICPIPSKYEGKKWDELPAKALQYALNHADEVPQLKPGHIEAIKETLKNKENER